MKINKTNKSKMTPKQQRYLTERLDLAWRTKFGWAAPDTSDKPSPMIVALRQRIAKDQVVVERWERLQRDKKTKRENAAKAERSKVQEAIMFGDPDAALTALRKFEALK